MSESYSSESNVAARTITRSFSSESQASASSESRPQNSSNTENFNASNKISSLKKFLKEYEDFVANKLDPSKKVRFCHFFRSCVVLFEQQLLRQDRPLDDSVLKEMLNEGRNQTPDLCADFDFEEIFKHMADKSFENKTNSSALKYW